MNKEFAIEKKDYTQPRQIELFYFQSFFFKMHSGHKSNLLLVFLLCACFQFCVPLKKQIILQDKTKSTVRQIQKVDTILNVSFFEYKLKPKDIVSVNLISITKGDFDFSALSQMNSGGQQSQQSGIPNNTGYIIDEKGEVLLPILGKVKISDLSLIEAEKEIQKVADKYMDNITVSVRMLNFFVYVMGEFKAQGKIFSPGNNKMTLNEAVAISGGFSEFADREKIKIIRNENNTAHIYYVDMLDQNIMTRKEFYLLPNDIIIGDPLRVKNIRTYTIANLSLAFSTISFILLLYLNTRNLIR